MRKESEISEIQKIVSTKEDIYLFGNKKLLDKQGNTLLDDINDVFVRIGIMYYQNEKGLFTFNSEKRIFEKISNINASTYEPISKTNIIVKDYETNYKVLKKYRNEILEWKIRFSGAFYNLLEHNIFLLRDAFKTRVITSINVETGKYRWAFEFPEKYYQSGKLLVVESIIILNLYSNDSNSRRVVGLYCKNGEIAWELSYQTPFDENLVISEVHKTNNLCYGYYGKKYQVFDPIKGQILFEKDMTTYYKRGVVPTKNSIFGKKLWFVSGKGENVKFGSLDIETSEIDFIMGLSLENDEQLDVPIYYGGKLYLRGLYYKTLHIFTEEENLSIS